MSITHLDIQVYKVSRVHVLDSLEDLFRDGRGLYFGVGNALVQVATGTIVHDDGNVLLLGVVVVVLAVEIDLVEANNMRMIQSSNDGNFIQEFGDEFHRHASGTNGFESVQ